METRDPHGNVKGKYGYIDELGEIKTVDYVAGKPGFSPQGQHLPIPNGPILPASSGNFDDEFGTDEDWESVDADEDGNPDPPRPAALRNTPIRPAFQQPAPSFRPVQPVPLRPAGPPFPFQLAGPAGQQRFVPAGFRRIPPV